MDWRNAITITLVVLVGVAAIALWGYSRNYYDFLNARVTQNNYSTSSEEPDTSSAPTSTPIPEQQVEGAEDRASGIEPVNQTIQATIQTSMGSIDIELYGEDAPITVGNFVKLARADFYDSTTFHRVIPDFMVQAGDPLSKDPVQRPLHGTGGPGYTFEDEINERPIVRGSLAMANSGPNTNGSQFFLVTAPATPWLDGRHTNFGRVVRGIEIVDAISKVERDGRDNPVRPVVIQDIIIKTPLIFAPGSSASPSPSPTSTPVIE